MTIAFAIRESFAVTYFWWCCDDKMGLNVVNMAPNGTQGNTLSGAGIGGIVP